jgi:hypothetical protein
MNFEMLFCTAESRLPPDHASHLSKRRIMGDLMSQMHTSATQTLSATVRLIDKHKKSHDFTNEG